MQTSVGKRYCNKNQRCYLRKGNPTFIFSSYQHVIVTPSQSIIVNWLWCCSWRHRNQAALQRSALQWIPAHSSIFTSKGTLKSCRSHILSAEAKATSRNWDVEHDTSVEKPMIPAGLSSHEKRSLSGGSSLLRHWLPIPVLDWWENIP